MTEKEKKMEILQKIHDNFTLTETDEILLDRCFIDAINLPRLETVIDTMIEYKIQSEVLIAYVLFQAYKTQPEETEALGKKYFTEAEQKLFETFYLIKDVRAYSKKDEDENIRKLFIAICQDIRIVIVKLATILFDLKQISLPLKQEDKDFVELVNDVFAPLAERLGLSKFKFAFEDYCFEVLEPKVFTELKNNVYLRFDENQEQIEITTKNLEKILQELHIKGEIQSRQKHFSSIYKKIKNKHVTLDSIYDLIAMRVLVDTVDDCYSVLGKVHSIYKPFDFRVKDYIANPKANGYQSLHTTIIAENGRPLEIQIRTFEMHKFAEYGIAAHWIYKEKRGQNKFDQKMTWFRQMMENAESLPPEEFAETLKVDLYSESIFVQTPMGKVLEFPQNSTVIDFAYAIHTKVGNTCVGAKINGKIVPITSTLSNGDVVEILTNPNSKGPSRDWLQIVKTNGARSKIRAFFKTELKDENIRVGKSIVEQGLKNKGIVIGKTEKEDYLEQIAKMLILENVDGLYAEVGAGSLSINSVIGRFINLYNKDRIFKNEDDKITVKRNKDGVLIDGDSGLLIRFAGCCSPIKGDKIIGYISRGLGVTIHKANCPNLKYLESERFMTAEWEDSAVSSFTTVIKIHADNVNSVINNLNALARELKTKLKGFGYKEIKNELVFDIVVQVSNTAELENLIRVFENVKYVRRVYRSE